jgi:hypothetical protein
VGYALRRVFATAILFFQLHPFLRLPQNPRGPLKEGWGTLGMVRDRKSREKEWATRQEAYSHEMINAGWSTGGGDVKDAAFYCYAAPTPRGFAEQKVRPAAAFYHQTTGEFLLMKAGGASDLVAFHEICRHGYFP